MTAGTLAHRFGSWNDAVEAAGFTPNPPDDDRYTDEELLDWIRSYVATFDCLPRESEIRAWPGPTYRTYYRRFGSLPAAVEAAGFDHPEADADD